LLTFTDQREAEEALALVESDYDNHSRAAREFAAEFLDAKRVIGRMLRLISLS
jgi:hypothetical protein